MNRLHLLALVACAALAPSACHSSTSTPAQTPTPDAPPLLQLDCDPIQPGACGYPFPSNVWTTPDSTTATGLHLYFGHTSLPIWQQPDKHIDPTAWANRDGFSPGVAPIVYLPDATAAGLPDPDHIADSLKPDCPTVIIEAATGARVPHWDEIDSTHYTRQQGGVLPFFVRTAVRLKDATRYIVAIRNVHDSNGATIPPSPAFQALRDGTPSDDLSVAPRRDLYADIFAKLQTAGVDKSDLQIAWDFTTASKDNTTKWLVHMRDDALAKVGNDGPPYKIKTLIDSGVTWQAQKACASGDFVFPKATPNGMYYQCTTAGTTGATEPAWPAGCADANGKHFIVQDGTAVWTCIDGFSSKLRKRIVGTMTVPLYTDKPDPGCSLVFGSDGMPKASGTADFEFLVQIPNAATKGPLAILQNGHGLFGEKEEGQNGFLADTIDREGYVEIAVELIGMAHDDVNFVSNVMLVSDIGQFQHLVDRMHQGFLNELLAMRMMRGKMATDPATFINGKPTIDPTTSYYRGDSQGGISGGVYMAVTTDAERGLLGETGAPYDMLLGRSVDFNSYFLLINSVYTSALDVQLLLGLIQSLWDRSEPDGYLPYISDPNNLLPGNKTPHNLLMHIGIGDHQVAPLGAHFEARTIGAKTLKQAPRPLFGIDAVDSGFTGNGIVEWDFSLPAAPLTNTPMSECDDPHDYIRKFTEAQDMQDQFFRTGKVNMTCNGGAGPCKAPAGWEDPSYKKEDPACP